MFLTRDEQQNYNNTLKINRSMEQINETDSILCRYIVYDKDTILNHG